MSNFTPKRAGETEVFTVDFSALLATGETITSAAWSISVVSGSDPSAASMIDGSASISGSKVSQLITGGVSDVTYAPICTANTSLGQVLILPDPGRGFLQVV